MLTVCGSPEIEYFEKSSKYPQTGLHLTSPLLSFLFKNISYLIPVYTPENVREIC